MAKLKEQIARQLHDMVTRFAERYGTSIPKEWEDMRDTAKAHYLKEADQVLNLFKEEVDKLTVIGDKEIKTEFLRYNLPEVEVSEECIKTIEQLIAIVRQAQLNHNRNEISGVLE